MFDEKILKEIVSSNSFSENEVVIEIGSGYGTLTSFLAKTNCEKVISIEKDEMLFQRLEIINQDKKISYINEDALEVNWGGLCKNYKDKKIILFGNLPYYISNSLIVNLLINRKLFSSFFFLIQKEVGQKWTSSPTNYSPNYSALPVFINFLAKTEIIFEVDRSNFTPAPSVDGALVRIEILDERKDIKNKKILSFFKFLKSCFLSRRKTLINNLLGFLGKTSLKYLTDYFQEKKYDLNLRPQNFNSEEYFEMFVKFDEMKKSLLL